MARLCLQLACATAAYAFLQPSTKKPIPRREIQVKAVADLLPDDVVNSLSEEQLTAHVARLARVIADAEASASATLAAGATPQSVLQPMWGAEMGVEARYVPHSSSDLSFISRSGSDLNHF